MSTYLGGCSELENALGISYETECCLSCKMDDESYLLEEYVDWEPLLQKKGLPAGGWFRVCCTHSREFDEWKEKQSTLSPDKE